jgi:hypothetical protein
METWNLSHWLESLAYFVAIAGGIAGAIIYLYGVRKSSIESTIQTIARAWTNEGDISSTESTFVTLELKNIDGDLVGSISTSAQTNTLEAHATVGWFSTELQVSELLGRNIVTIGTAKLRLIGNRNRLKWNFNGKKESALLPEDTLLWPSSVSINN